MQWELVFFSFFVDIISIWKIHLFLSSICAKMSLSIYTLLWIALLCKALFIFLRKTRRVAVCKVSPKNTQAHTININLFSTTLITTEKLRNFSFRRSSNFFSSFIQIQRAQLLLDEEKKTFLPSSAFSREIFTTIFNYLCSIFFFFF